MVAEGDLIRWARLTRKRLLNGGWLRWPRSHPATS